MAALTQAISDAVSANHASAAEGDDEAAAEQLRAKREAWQALGTARGGGSLEGGGTVASSVTGRWSVGRRTPPHLRRNEKVELHTQTIAEMSVGFTLSFGLSNRMTRTSLAG